MSLSTAAYKGARDFYPEDKRLQKHLFSVMRRVVERFGYEEYDAPILEPIELYLAKSGEEIVNEQTYVFEDRGGRTVTLRPEMTPTVSRMVAAQRQELSYPLRWYSIPNLWRYERPQRGRLREHWQLNVDLFGLDDLSGDAELIQVADAILKEFGAKRSMYSIKLNSRKLMNFIMHDYLGMTPVQAAMMARLIDRMHKLPADEFAAEADAIFTPAQRDENASTKLLGLLKIKEIAQLPAAIRTHSAAIELEKLRAMLGERRVTNTVFDITLMRGLDYYTDIVFEVFDTNPDNNRAMFGGGRYDGLVGLFGVEPVGTVGFGMGDVTMRNFLESHDLLPAVPPETDAYVVLIGDVIEKAQPAIANFRKMGLNVAVDTTGRKADKQIKAAEKKGIHFVIFIGDKELSDDQYEIRNLTTGNAERHGASRLVSIIKDYRLGGKDADDDL